MSISFPSKFRRLNRTPLDDSTVFNTLVDFEMYLSNGAAYAGQLVAVRNATNIPDVYRVNEDYSYSPLDGNSSFSSNHTVKDIVVISWANYQTLKEAYGSVAGHPFHTTNYKIPDAPSSEESGGTSLDEEQLAAIEKAKTAVQPADIAGFITGSQVDGKISDLQLDSASKQPVSAFASAAQGVKADTALQPSAIDDMVESNGSVDKIVHMTWSAYNALSVKDSKTIYNISDAPTPTTGSAGVLINVEYASNDNTNTITDATTGMVNRENGSLGIRQNITTATWGITKTISFLSPYNPITDTIELQFSADRINWTTQMGGLSAVFNGNWVVPLVYIDASNGYGMSFYISHGASQAVNATGVLCIGRRQMSPTGTTWNTIPGDWYYRVVKKTFLQTSLTEWNMLKGLAIKTAPHTWPVGVEMDFGDGSFGRRYVGTTSAAANANSSLDVEPSLTHASGVRLVSYGGWWGINNDANLVMAFGTAYGSLIFSTCYIGTYGLRIQLCSNVIRTNQPYDIWVIYRRG